MFWFTPYNGDSSSFSKLNATCYIETTSLNCWKKFICVYFLLAFPVSHSRHSVFLNRGVRTRCCSNIYGVSCSSQRLQRCVCSSLVSSCLLAAPGFFWFSQRVGLCCWYCCCLFGWTSNWESLLPVWELHLWPGWFVSQSCGAWGCNFETCNYFCVLLSRS